MRVKGRRFKVTLTTFVEVRPEARDDEVRRAALMQIYLAAVSNPMLVYEEVKERGGEDEAAVG